MADDVPGKPRGASMRDVWAHEDVPIMAGRITLSLNVHDSLLAVLEQTSEEW